MLIQLPGTSLEIPFGLTLFVLFGVGGVLEPDDSPAAVLLGGGNVQVAVAVQVDEEGVVHFLA